MTLSELREQVRFLLDEPEEGFFLDKEIDLWINEGYYDIAKTAKHIKETAYMLTTSDTFKYELPDNFIEEFKVFLNDEKFNPVPLEDKEIEEGYFIWEDDFCFSITPPENGELVIYYYRKPIAKLIDDTDEPEVPIEYQNLLVNYALYKAKTKDKDANLSQYYYQEYLRGLSTMKNEYATAPRRNTFKVKR